MASTALVIAWDTSVLIDVIQKTPGKWEGLAPMLNLAITGDVKIVISTVSVAECYYLKYLASTGMSQPDQNNLIEKWLENPYLVKRAADFGTCRIAAEIGRLTNGGLTPNDAIIAATAVRHEAGALITYDDTAGTSLLKQDGKIPTKGGGSLRICTPEGWTKDNSPQLFP